MDIYPQDLGALGQSILLGREPLSQYDPDAPLPPWMVGVAVTGAAILVSLGVGKVYGPLYGPLVVWAGVLVSVLLGVAVAVLGRRRGVRLWTEGPLTALEVQGLRVGLTDPPCKPYLDLVLAVIGTPPPQDAEAHVRVREAVRALGESIAGLPPTVADGVRDDPAALTAQAEQFTRDAAAEGDPVIVASLRRRAEALHRQAETAARTNTLLRRNEALRQEVAGQIAALQTSLTALRVGGAQAVYELAGVAASIQQVAVEAGALTQARSEIGEIVNSQALTRG